jgi:hypothetical protein
VLLEVAVVLVVARGEVDAVAFVALDNAMPVADMLAAPLSIERRVTSRRDRFMSAENRAGTGGRK